MMKMYLREVVKKMKAYMAMIFLQIGYAGMVVISMISLKQGMSHYVLVVYRNAVAALAMAPFALWFERKMRPRMTMSCFLKILLLALLEPVLDQNFFYMGNKATSANYAIALYNVLPAMTFVLAVLLRMEKININDKHSQAKIIGTLVSVLGALVMILYKGNVVDFPWTRGWHDHNTATTSGGDISTNSSHWLAGTFMLLWSCLCWSGFFILQSHTLKSYPAELSLASLICFFGTLESGAVALVMEKGTKPWALAWDTSLFTPVYSGVMCSGVAYYLQGIVMKERGPVFVTAFNPLCMIIVAILASIILAEDITVGRVIGAVIIVMGLYLLIWGKSKDNMDHSIEIDEKESTMELEKNANKGRKANGMDYVTVVEIPPSKIT
ncbi:putative EamA domain-containing protein [Dioscorea sansibarensis]